MTGEARSNKSPLLFGSLFSGLGGLDLGLERAGLRCAFQVEIEDYPTRVLHRHWPEVPKFKDVREVGAHNLPAVHVLAGGFPCQDLSSAGKRKGINGARSGLWSEFARLIRELQPLYVIIENVEALRHKGRGLHRVLGDLSACGFDAEWQVLPAYAFGAPHKRERLFIVAYSRSLGRGDGHRSQVFAGSVPEKSDFWPPGGPVVTIEDLGLTYRSIPASVRVDDGFSYALERVKGCGNAVVPQVATFVGKQLVEFHQTNTLYTQ